VRAALAAGGAGGEVVVLDDTSRTAADALGRADADYVKRASGFSIGGVAPVGWAGDTEPVVLIDEALADYDAVWAAGGHPHAVFPTSYDELVRLTGARPVRVGDD
jgi:prolyl-tRNA editing enzyme YbaK/EbsC (Cys-tRNA(Pro) deacylase)